MKKNYSNFILACLLFFAGNIFSQTFTQITTSGELTSDQYLIVADGTTNDGLMLNTVTAATPYINYSSISNPGASITSGYTSANIFDITVSGGVITIYNSTNGYASWGRTDNTTNTATFYSGTVASTEQWTPTVASGLWTLANVSGSTRLLQWNNSSPRFACYTSAQVKLKLYKIKYTVTYNGNGNTGGSAPTDASSPYFSGATVTVKANTGTLAKTGFTFSGWNTAADGSGTDYAASGSATLTMPSENVVLYAKWTSSGTPTLSASTFAAFGSQCTGGTYGPNTFTITGTALTTADVTVAALSGYTYSTTSGGTYTSSLTLTQAGGAYSQDIYVKFAPASAISYNGNIVVGGGGATSINVAASGSGVATVAQAVSSAAATAITGTTANINGNVTALGACPATTEKGFVWSATSTDNDPFVGDAGVTKTTVAGITTGAYNLGLTSLANGTNYTFKAYVYEGTTYTYGATLNFTTLAPPVNDACAGAIDLVINDPATNGTLISSTSSSSPFTAKNDVWYKFTPTCTGSHSITVTGFSGDVDVHLFNQSSSCPTTATTIGTALTSNSSEVITSNLSSGITYYIRVYAFNTDAESSDFTVRVTTALAPLSMPGVISGNTPVCEGTSNTYSISTVAGATSYTWTLPVGWSGTSTTNSIISTIGSSGGTISVTANNGCGSSPARTLPVTVNAAPANPTGTALALANPSCGATTVSYSAPSSNIYWQTAANGTSTSNPTTSSYPVSVTNSTIYARAYNGTCWSTGTVNSGSITIYTQPTISTQPTDQTVASPTGTSFTATASNATGYQWQYYNGSTWTNLSNTAPYSGVTSATLTLSSTTEAMDGTDYRCIVNANSPCTSITSNVATLYVTPGPCITDATGYTGWILLSGATASNNQACSGNGILFTATNQYAITPAVTNPLKLNFNKKRSSNTASWKLKVQISTSTSGPWTDVDSITSISATCTANPEIDLSSYTGAQYIRFLDARSSGAHERGIDDITITCGTTCTPTHTITSFAPTSGPAGTLVTITGTGFTAVSGANGVKFGSSNATSYTIVNATTIIAEVPAGTSTDKISVVNNSCVLKSTTDFTVIETSGTCGSGGAYSSDVFISEIYDHNNGSLTYIEIFNGTLSTVNLSDYSIRVQTNTTDNYYTLSGTIASNTTKILKIGSYNSYTCLTADWDNPSAPGINGNDQVSLYKNSGATLVDYAPNPNYDASALDNGAQLIGFTQKRKATATAPSTTYIASDWTVSNTQSCSHLGTGPYTVSAPALNITSHPANVGCTSSITFTVAANAGAPATITSPGGYVWKFNDPTSMSSWDNVSALTVSPYNLALTISGTGTNSITITGNTAILLNYQFYVEVSTAGSPSCTKASNAAQYNYNTRKIYRSKDTGNWSDATKWEMSNDFSTWIAACNYPTSRNSSEAIIQTGTGIILDIDNDIDKLTIETTGTLEVSANSVLSVYDSTANADLLINGTYYDRANSANSLNLSGSATWQLGAAGSIIKSNTSGAAVYRDQYEGGIANIPATAAWTYRYNGDGNPTVVSAGMYYPHLFFENTTGTPFSFNNTLMILSGGTAPSSMCTVKGNCNIGTTGTTAVTVYNNNISTSPMLIYGNLNVGASSIFSNASYNGGSSSSYGNGTGFEIKGNLLNNGTFDNNSANTGITKLSGTGTQTISGSGTFDLWDVELDKTAQTLVDAQVNLTANNNLNFIGGILKTNTNVFTVANGSIANAVTGFETPYTGSSAPSYANDKYIWGSLERLVNTTGTYVYPIGDNASGEAYNPIRFDVQSGTTSVTYATAKFIPGDPGTCLVGPEYFSCAGNRNFLHYTDMTGQGKWRMNSSSGTTFGYNVYLHPNQNNLNEYPNEDVTVYPLFYRNIYRALKAPSGTTDWSAYVLNGDVCTVGSYYNAPGFGYTGFSDFAIPGGNGASTALPVELTSFTGTCIGNGVAKITWSTASELNSRNFILQRSSNGSNFTTIASVNAAGNSNQPLNYSVYDSTLVSNGNYYRLIEVDADGKQTIYSFILVECREVDGMNIYYNEPKVVVEINSNTDRQVSFNVYEVSGKLLHQENKQVVRGYNRFNLSIEKKLADGIYIIQLVDGKKISSSKLWVH